MRRRLAVATRTGLPGARRARSPHRAGSGRGRPALDASDASVHALRACTSNDRGGLATLRTTLATRVQTAVNRRRWAVMVGSLATLRWHTRYSAGPAVRAWRCPERALCLWLTPTRQLSQLLSHAQHATTAATAACAGACHAMRCTACCVTASSTLVTRSALTRASRFETTDRHRRPRVLTTSSVRGA